MATGDRGLNDNQRRFIAHYRSRLPRNASWAYEQVYTQRGEKARVSASQLLTNPNVRDEIDRLDAEDLRDLGLTAASLLRGVMRNAFSDARALFDADGSLRPVHTLPDDIAAAISGVDVTETMAPGPDGEPILQRTRKIRLWSKPDAQKLLATYLQLLVVKVEHSGSVTVHEQLLTDVSSKKEALRHANGHSA
jgi:hypothetical protein